MSKRRESEQNVIEAAIEATKGLDVFPKIQEDYTQTSSTRGTISILVYLFIGILVFLEVRYFFEDQLNYSYEVDFDYLSKLKLNIDMSVATSCELIGADVIDSTSALLSNQPINMTDTWFELSDKQNREFAGFAKFNNLVRENYHALHLALWGKKIHQKMSEREILPNYPKDACRITGNLELNKVMGLFHVISGKPVNIMGQHAHSMKIFQQGVTNFSHRIDTFSFGDNSDLVHNALNYEMKISQSLRTVYQYFVSVVATEVNLKKTFQYSVTEKVSVANHETGNHGQPGISFKYDISPVKVKVNLDKKPYIDLIIPLIGLVGGIFATSTMLNSLFELGKDYLKI